jgi:hypothetical protein
MYFTVIRVPLATFVVIVRSPRYDIYEIFETIMIVIKIYSVFPVIIAIKTLIFMYLNM